VSITSGLWFLAPPPAAARPVSAPGLAAAPWSADTVVIAAAQDAPTLAIVNATDILLIDCRSLPCRLLHHAAVSLLNPTAACVIASTGTDAPAELWVGSARGLTGFLIDSSAGKESRITWARLGANISEPISALACSGQSVVATTATLVWRFLPDTLSWRFERVLAAVDSTSTAAAFSPDGTLWLGTRVALTVQTRDLRFWRIGGRAGNPGGIYGGLPFSNMTALAAASSPDGTTLRVWVGTTRGVSLWQQPLTNVSTFIPGADGSWSYFYGLRWLPGQSVTSLSPTADGSGVWIATDDGLAWLASQQTTLAQKAAYYETILIERHNRLGLATSASLTRFGDVSSAQPSIGESDGLWTSFNLLAMSYKYAVTRDEQVRV
jgi:ligand-binding sensor domain-containing protein